MLSVHAKSASKSRSPAASKGDTKSKKGEIGVEISRIPTACRYQYQPLPWHRPVNVWARMLDDTGACWQKPVTVPFLPRVHDHMAIGWDLDYLEVTSVRLHPDGRVLVEVTNDIKYRERRHFIADQWEPCTHQPEGIGSSLKAKALVGSIPATLVLEYPNEEMRIDLEIDSLVKRGDTLVLPHSKKVACVDMVFWCQEELLSIWLDPISESLEDLEDVGWLRWDDYKAIKEKMPHLRVP